MFARRAGWDLTPNAFSERVAARRAAGLPLLDLADSNPTRCALAAPGAALREALGALAVDGAALRYAPDPRGDPAARAAIAACHTRGGSAPSAEHVVLCAGTSEGYAHLYRLLADPGDRIHLPTPGYPLFTHLAALEGLEVVPYPLRAPAAPAGRSGEGGWRIDLDALAADLSPRSRAILLIDPHNPTGSFVHADDRAALAATAAERGLALISDEVFADYATAQATRSDPDAAPAPLRFALSGASKLLGLPQLKLAWIVVAGTPALRDDALARLEFMADAFLSVSPLVASVLPALLAARGPIQAEIRARVAANLAHLGAAAADAFELLRPQAGWSAVLRVRQGTRAGAGPPDEEALAIALLDGHGVLVQPGYLFDLEPRDERGLPCAHLVVSLLPEPERFESGIDALRALVRDPSPR